MPFNLTISSDDVDSFLLDRMDKKLRYWVGRKLNFIGRTIIANIVLISTTLYFLAIWGGLGNGVKRIKAKTRNYLWASKDRPSRARVAWNTCCLRKRDGGLGLMDPFKPLTALMAKWIISACEPGNSNFKIMLRYRLSHYQSYSGGNWEPSLQWFLLRNHAAKNGSSIWNQVARSWKHLV
jgi:hypothetical protein